MNDLSGWQQDLYQVIHPTIPPGVRGNILLAVSRVTAWLDHEASPDLLRNIRWRPSSGLWRTIGFHHVELSTVFLDPRNFTVETAIHELAHILDNRLAAHPLASIFGGGPSDDMLRYIGIEPDQFFPRFSAPGYERMLTAAGCELNTTQYGRSKGPAEDFAEGFRLAVLQPDYLAKAAPCRFAWFAMWKKTLTDRY